MDKAGRRKKSRLVIKIRISSNKGGDVKPHEPH